MGAVRENGKLGLVQKLHYYLIGATKGSTTQQQNKNPSDNVFFIDKYCTTR